LSAELNPSHVTFMDPEPLKAYCREVSFPAGAALRTKGHLSVDMYLLTDGEVEVSIDRKLAPSLRLAARRGAPIGEIGFLTGVPATATVTARTDARALYIDNSAWRELERRQPDLAVELYRHLAEVADGRQSHNLLFRADEEPAREANTAEIVLCQTPELLHSAQQIRYQIYCGELGRTSPFADAEKGIIADELDETGHVLLALDNGVPVATLRMNMRRDGSLGLLEDLYGMAQSPHHPEGTAICTKFIVKKSHRLGQFCFRLMSTAVEMAQRYDIKHCYIDCIPELRPFYATLGFAQSGPAFLHRENGRSYPLMLDIDRYARRIARLSGFVLR
jgi:predicted GNAT family N-acyltransferase